jgi:hypothetical protein
MKNIKGWDKIMRDVLGVGGVVLDRQIRVYEEI